MGGGSLRRRAAGDGGLGPEKWAAGGFELLEPLGYAKARHNLFLRAPERKKIGHSRRNV